MALVDAGQGQGQDHARAHARSRAGQARAQGAAAVTVLALLGGCSSVPMLPALHRDEPPRISFPAPPADSEVKISNLAVGEGAQAGGGAGALGGALWGLACGPLALLCIPFTVSAGMLAGTGAGATIGLTGALVPEKAERLRARLTQVRASHDVPGELREQVLRRARQHWDLQTEPAKAVVSVQLLNLALTSTRDEQVGLVLKVLVSAQREPPLPGAVPTEKLFSCAPAPSPLAVWLDERNDYVDVTLSGCTQQIAAQIVGEFARP